MIILVIVRMREIIRIREMTRIRKRVPNQGLPGLPETKRAKLIISSIFNIVTIVQLKLLLGKTSLYKLVLNLSYIIFY